MNVNETNVSIEQQLMIHRDIYLEARMEYELSLRKYSMLNVDKCPCCFDKFYENKKEELTTAHLTGEIKPNEIEILELMAMTPVVDGHGDDESIESNE